MVWPDLGRGLTETTIWAITIDLLDRHLNPGHPNTKQERCNSTTKLPLHCDPRHKQHYQPDYKMTPRSYLADRGRWVINQEVSQFRLCPSQLKETAWPHTASYQIAPLSLQLILCVAPHSLVPNRPLFTAPLSSQLILCVAPHSLVPNRPLFTTPLYSQLIRREILSCVRHCPLPEGYYYLIHTTFRELRTT